jgi:hypothetical protein
MVYSAMSVANHMQPSHPQLDSAAIFACSYFNVVLPSFFPSNATGVQKTFWHRARLSKQQSTRAALHPMLISRIREMARVRAQRAQVWAKEDDEKVAGVWTPPPPPPKSDEQLAKEKQKTPSVALMGLSSMGNLDKLYHHAEYPTLNLHGVTAATRLRHQGIIA